MNNLTFTDILAAILAAGIIAMLAGFVSHKLYHPQHLEKNAYEIAAAEDTGGTPGAAEQTAAGPIDVEKADLAKGEKIAKVCSSCHTFESGGANKVGPNLFGIVGKSHAHEPSFAYSEAMKAKAGAKWDREALNQFLWNPKKILPGTKMTFLGLKKDDERASVIKWLETQR